MRHALERYVLRKAELLAMEKELVRLLRRFVQFDKAALYFPDRDANWTLTWLPEEALILAPVKWRGQELAMLRVEGLAEEGAPLMASALESLIGLALERLLLEKLAERDPFSGLSTEARLFKYMEEEFNSITSLKDERENGAERSLYRLCLGLVVISWKDEQMASRLHDHEFAEEIYKSLAQAVSELLPQNALAAPLGRYEGSHDLGILINATGRGACLKLAQKILEKMKGIDFIDRLSGRSYRPLLSAGHALYPQDMPGGEMRLPLFEQTLRFRNRARLAAQLAADLSSGERILSFAGILEKAGRVLEFGQRDKVRINLGANANVRPGMRFLVWGQERPGGKSFCKGQISVLKAGSSESIAELLYLDKAAHVPEKGDMLTFASRKNGIRKLYHHGKLENDSASAEEIESMHSSAIPVTGEERVMNQGEFLEYYTEELQKTNSFLFMAIGFSSHENIEQDIAETLFQNLLAHAQNSSLQAGPPRAGRYGTDRLLVFWPETEAKAALQILEELFKERNPGEEVACGIAQYPCLDFSKADMESNAQKALEYARLLPEPHIGLFDSMAMTISADKKFSLGDEFGAIEEYRRALLADEANALARNSLGVCLASLGKNGEAKKIWLEALNWARDGELRAKVCYNLGTVCIKGDQSLEASRWFRNCLKYHKRHVFAWLRMGQLNERKNRKNSARRYYLCAANLSEPESEAFGIAHRYLARLDASANSRDSARSALHQLLLKNPHDLASMNILADLYLKEEGDPAIAEMLARKSLQLRDNAEAWKILARSLHCLGRNMDAEKANERAERREKGG